jgi:hypothetical protein
MELNIPRLVNTMYVSKCGHDTEVGTERVQCDIDIPDIGGLSVQRGVVHTCVVHTIFFIAGDTNFHLKPDPDRRHVLEVRGADFDVFVLRLLGQVKHVRGKESFAMLLEVLFVGLEHTVEPWEELLGAVVAVQDNWPDKADQSTRCFVKKFIHTRRRPWPRSGCAAPQRWLRGWTLVACSWQVLESPSLARASTQ